MTDGDGEPRGSRSAGARPRSRPGPLTAEQRLLREIEAGRQARRQRAILTVAAVVSALVLVTSGGAWAVTTYVTGHLDRLSVGTSGTPESGPLNILVAGVDERSGLTPEQERELHVGHDVSTNSDTLMLVHVPADHSYLEVVSLPRDSWVNIPGHGMNKINAAFGLGGPKLMVQTVAAATGLTINDYIEVNFLGFVKVIDALGGVNICLPFAVNDAYSGLDLSAGVHHVDGITALEFARDRHSFAASDLARIDDQQQLMATVLSKAASTGTLSDPFKLRKVIASVTSAIQVDQGFNLVSLASQLSGLRPQNVAFTTVPLANLSYQTPTGESAVLWDSAAAGQLFGQIRADQRPAAVAPPPRPKPGHQGKSGAPARHTAAPRPSPSQATGTAAGGQQKTAAEDTCH
ncbi:MAG TPA: LCP family protein [Streptosporangiaceae bacterium]|nr:LCP family protein [Streptosporangiaceae bacterium]